MLLLIFEAYELKYKRKHIGENATQFKILRERSTHTHTQN